MNDIIFYLVAGIGIGSLYAMLGAGLVVVYKGSGVINFAQGAMAMYGVATFDRAWNRGEIFLPWVDILPDDRQPAGPDHAQRQRRGADGRRHRDRPGDGRPARPGRPLPRLPPAAPRRPAGQGRRLARPGALPAGRGAGQLRHQLPDAEVGLPRTRTTPFDNFLGLGNPFPRNSLFAFFAALILGAIVWAVYKFTRFGMATRAAASNEKGAVLLGYSPQRLAATNWVAASMLVDAGGDPRRPDPGPDHARSG